MALALPVESIVISCIICFYLIIFLPYIIYATFRLYKNRNEKLIKYRNVKLVLAMQSVFILLSLERILYVFIIGDPLQINIKMSNELYQWLLDIAIIILDLCLCFYASLFCLRMWLLYFQVNFSLSMENQQWKQIINPTSKPSFFILFGNTLGSAYWLFIKCVIPICCMIATIQISVYFVTKSFVKLLISNALISVIPSFIFIGIIYCKTPQFKDLFYVRQEIKLCLFALILTAILFVTIFIIDIILFDKLWIHICMIELIISFLIGILSYIQTFWVLKQSKLNANKSITLRKKRTADLINDYNFELKQLTDDEDKHGGAPLKPQMSETSYDMILMKYSSTMETSETFHLFCLHLIHEWSIENMCAFIEYLQLFQLLLPYLPQELKIFPLLKNYKFGNIASIPKSHIVYNNNKFGLLSSKLHALYNKYISSSSKMPLNLRHELKTEWKISLFGGDDTDDISQTQTGTGPLDFFKQVSALISSFNNDDKLGHEPIPHESKDENDIEAMGNMEQDDNGDLLLGNKSITIDVSLEQYVPLIRKVLENNHLLLLDSFSRFNPERKRALSYTVSDPNSPL